MRNCVLENCGAWTMCWMTNVLKALAVGVEELHPERSLRTEDELQWRWMPSPFLEAHTCAGCHGTALAACSPCTENVAFLNWDVCTCETQVWRFDKIWKKMQNSSYNFLYELIAEIITFLYIFKVKVIRVPVTCFSFTLSYVGKPKTVCVSWLWPAVSPECCHERLCNSLTPCSWQHSAKQMALCEQKGKQ